MDLDLAVVMPVYNEESCIEKVVRSWKQTLTKLNIRFLIMVLNDGSTDGTGKELASFASDGVVEVIHKPNSGHGPTIMMGYKRAVDVVDWVFQCDSDDEMKPEHFPELWKLRNDFDALFGIRQGVRKSVPRAVISWGSRTVVRLLFGGAVKDVNVPYRLIRSQALAEIINRIPDDVFAPNVIMSGLLTAQGFSVYNHPVPHQCRATGKVSIRNWKLYKAVLASLWQTCACRFSPSVVGKPKKHPPPS